MNKTRCCATCGYELLRRAYGPRCRKYHKCGYPHYPLWEEIKEE